MKTRLLYGLFSLSLSLSAQTAGILSVEPAEISKEIVIDNLDEYFEDVTSVVVTNNSGRTIQLIRETVAGRRPRGWTYSTSDRRNRATPYVMSEAEQKGGRPILLGPGESATFFVALKPDGVPGTGNTEIRFSDLTLPGTSLAAVRMTTKIIQRQSSEPQPEESAPARPQPTSVRLYPNPAPERFFVEAPRGTRIGKVEIANTLGRQIRSFSRGESDGGYDIEDLPDGLYLISIYDERGKKLKTLRLLHRQFGA